MEPRFFVRIDFTQIGSMFQTAISFTEMQTHLT